MNLIVQKRGQRVPEKRREEYESNDCIIDAIEDFKLALNVSTRSSSREPF
jgi:hypothetical protein